MFYLEPFFSEDTDPQNSSTSSHPSLPCSEITNYSILKNDSAAKYKELAHQIIDKCHQDLNGMLDFFDTVCRDLSSPCLTDKAQSYELIMSVLAGTYSLDSTESFKEYIQDRYREKPNEVPELCDLIIKAFEILNGSDIDTILAASSFEALYRKAVRINLPSDYDERTHKFNETYCPIIESYINLDLADLDTIFIITDKYLNQLLQTVEDKHTCASFDLIAKTLGILGSTDKHQFAFITSYLDSLITSEDDFLAELAGYSFARIKEITPRFGSAIFEHLSERFNEAEDRYKEFWTIAIAEYSSRDQAIAPKCIGLLQPLIDGPDEFKVSYASEAIAKIVTQIGGNIWYASGIKDVGKHLLEKDPAFAISHQQRIIFIAKSISSIDADNYSQVISDIEDLFSTVRSSPLFSDIRDSIYLTLEEYVPYTAAQIHNNVLMRIEKAIENDDLPFEITELYAHLLKSSIDGYLDADPKVHTLNLDELVSRYTILSEKLSKTNRASLLSETVEEIGTSLYTTQMFNFEKNPVIDFD